MKKVFALLLVATIMVAFSSNASAVNNDKTEIVSFDVGVDVSFNSVVETEAINSYENVNDVFQFTDYFVKCKDKNSFDEEVEYSLTECIEPVNKTINKESDEPEPNLIEFVNGNKDLFNIKSPVLLVAISTNKGK